ncbi:hypothetical protein [Litchfieldella rifensis]|uniref:Uncharacterized protein n=1 Tax=Litchfieldella rifensis TaxID=762643 RepID=A0ABV7LTB2_9GAMM
MTVDETWSPLERRLLVVPLAGTISGYAAPGGYIDDDTDAWGIDHLVNIELLTTELTMAAGAERREAEIDNAERRDGSFFCLYLFYPYIGCARIAGRTVNEICSILMPHRLKWLSGSLLYRIFTWRSGFCE